MRTDTLPRLEFDPLPTRAARPRLPVRARARLSSPRALRWALLALLLLVVGVISAWGMTTYPARVDDEGTYVAQAWAVQHWGQLAHYTYWYDHPPLGWVQIAAWNWLTGALERAPYAVAAGREFMLVAKIASAGLIYVLARRLGVRRGWAVGAVVLFSLSPVALSFQRMVYLDNIATFWGLAAFALAMSPRRRLAAHAASAVCFAVCVLTKETTLILLPALLWQVWQGSDPRTRKFSFSVFFSVLVFSGSFYLLYAMLKSELLPGEGHVSLLEAISWQLGGRQSSGSIFDSSSDAWGVVKSWLELDAWLLGAALAVIPLGFVVARLRPLTLALAIQVVMLFREGYLPFPFVIGLVPFAAVLVAAIADVAWGEGGLRVGRDRWAARAPVVVAAVVAVAVIAPTWVNGIGAQMTEDHDLAMRTAQSWIEDNVPRDATVVVDDSLWVDLVRAGFDPHGGVVWFYKLDLDPGVQIPGGWRGVDYVVLGAMPPDIDGLPNLQELLAHSEVVGEYGSGPDTATIYEVQQ